MGKCDDTQTGGGSMLLGTVAQTGPPLHLQSECLVHIAGISCTASPSSGLGHLKMQGRLKQKTATEWDSYATGEEESRTSFLHLNPSCRADPRSRTVEPDRKHTCALPGFQQRPGFCSLTRCWGGSTMVLCAGAEPVKAPQ